MIDGEGRNETALERCDRNLVELLQEVRVVQTGVQVLFAFLLTAPLAARFGTLDAFQRHVYFATLLATGAAAVLLIAPTAYHRVLFQRGDKEHLVQVANRFTLAGLAFVAISMVGALLLVTDLLFSGAVVAVTVGFATLGVVLAWCVLPLRRRRAARPQSATSVPTPASSAVR
jgi:O-antigen/teichoic acid export membrane protein